MNRTDKNEILVSIICNAYNHELYIRDALEGFVMQKTDFAFEILVHDDASTDNTANIIREYEAKYPELIKPIYQTENQYSKGNGDVSRIQQGRAKGKYIAFCEGDDYWTDPYKLQKQFDALEANPDIDMCAHAARAVNATTGDEMYIVAPSQIDTVFPAEDVILGGGGFVASASLFFRSELYIDPPEFRRFLRMDVTLQIHGALRGGLLYLSDCMSVYRVMSKGSWSQRMAADKERRNKHFEKVQQMFNILDRETDGKYSTVIEQKKIKNEFDHYISIGQCRMIIKKKYRSELMRRSFADRVKIVIKAIIKR